MPVSLIDLFVVAVLSENMGVIDIIIDSFCMLILLASIQYRIIENEDLLVLYDSCFQQAFPSLQKIGNGLFVWSVNP